MKSTNKEEISKVQSHGKLLPSLKTGAQSVLQVVMDGLDVRRNGDLVFNEGATQWIESINSNELQGKIGLLTRINFYINFLSNYKLLRNNLQSINTFRFMNMRQNQRWWMSSTSQI